MASLSSSSYSVSPSSQSWKYDVFVSFRGEDTRKTFVDHLYSNLVQQGICTYKDDVTLPRGNCIGPSLFKAIEESRIAIIVFSENYADSSWCLDELAHIMKSRDERGQIVMPIFYHVDPSDMRKQHLNFTKPDWTNTSKAKTWKQALVDAANISGWVIKNTANGHEAQGIKEIVNVVSNNLLSPISNVNDEFIGIRTRLQELRSKLEVELGGVRMIGIWGIGGGGKTTLAYSIYHEISRKFDGCCFVDNIREKSSKYGIQILQEKVLSDVLKQKGTEVRSVEEGRHMIKSRLCHINVLIVLDDVDHLDQLNMLAGSHDWFGEGSRIIITTRDIHLLNAHKIKAKYNISLLNDDEAIKLFCKHAPKQDYIPTQLYETLSNEVVSYARGLPLALKVLGSFLCDKEVNEWRSALTRLKDIPEDDIIGQLKISYNGLKPIEKELFLDIACFYRGEEMEDAMITLDASGLHPVIGIKVLIQKSLITISKDKFKLRSQGKFDMHDLVQEMGHYIAQGEHRENPEKHSRIWREKEILSICSTNTTMNSDKIEALVFKFAMEDCPHHLPDIVATMKNLRSIYWKFYPLSVLPTNFQLTKLRCLILRGSNLVQLWEGHKVTGRQDMAAETLTTVFNCRQDMPELRWTRSMLSEKATWRHVSGYLLVPLELFPNNFPAGMEHLATCDWLSQKSDRIGIEKSMPISLKKLVKVPILAIFSTFKHNIYGNLVRRLNQHTTSDLYKFIQQNLPNLKVLDLRYSRKLIMTPDLRGLPCLERMILFECTSLREIHPSTGCHQRLTFLNLGSCESLEIFPPITRMPKLVTLILSHCRSLSKFPDIQTKMDSLEDICLIGSEIKVLPSSIVHYCTNLVSLDLSNCYPLKIIEVDFCRFKKMKELKLPPFVKLVTPEAHDLFNVDRCLHPMHQLPPPVNSDFLRFPHLPRFLTRLTLRFCNLLHKDIPSHIYELSSLQVLDLSGNTFSRISFNLVQFPRLKFLDISYCNKLVELPDLPSSISVLKANVCDSLKITRDFPTTYNWLWKVTLGDKVCGGENILRSMLQGNDTADHFMSFGRYGLYTSDWPAFAYQRFILQLPSNWYRDYSGFLVCVAEEAVFDLMIIIKQEMNIDDQFCRAEGFFGNEMESMCYIPFSSLMNRPLWNGTISFVIDWCRFRVELVRRRSEGGSTEWSTDCSEFWDEEFKDKKTFTIEHASETSIEVTWLNKT